MATLAATTTVRTALRMRMKTLSINTIRHGYTGDDCDCTAIVVKGCSKQESVTIASITTPNLDDARTSLRIRAAGNSRSRSRRTTFGKTATSMDWNATSLAAARAESNPYFRLTAISCSRYLLGNGSPTTQTLFWRNKPTRSRALGR